MATLQISAEILPDSTLSMNTVSASFRSKIHFSPSRFRGFCASPVLSSTDTEQLVSSRKKKAVLSGVRVRVKISNSQLKENWLDSLSCPFPETERQLSNEGEEPERGSGSKWVVGIDPDISGALALLKDDGSGSSAQVFDTPYLQALVGKRVRKRLDARSIVQLLHSFVAPLGTTAYIEQSIPFPQDGKQGWWSGGFTYGLWTGILVASGFSVVPVSSRLWKDQFELTGGSSNKDDSWEAASLLFPSLSSLLKKKDHELFVHGSFSALPTVAGRAEALLIAAYGKGLGRKSDLTAT